MSEIVLILLLAFVSSTHCSNPNNGLSSFNGLYNKAEADQKGMFQLSFAIGPRSFHLNFLQNDGQSITTTSAGPRVSSLEQKSNDDHLLLDGKRGDGINGGFGTQLGYLPNLPNQHHFGSIALNQAHQQMVNNFNQFLYQSSLHGHKYQVPTSNLAYNQWNLKPMMNATHFPQEFNDQNLIYMHKLSEPEPGENGLRVSTIMKKKVVGKGNETSIAGEKLKPDAEIPLDHSNPDLNNMIDLPGKGSKIENGVTPSTHKWSEGELECLLKFAFKYRNSPPNEKWKRVKDDCKFPSNITTFMMRIKFKTLKTYTLQETSDGYERITRNPNDTRWTDQEMSNLVKVANDFPRPVGSKNIEWKKVLDSVRLNDPTMFHESRSSWQLTKKWQYLKDLGRIIEDEDGKFHFVGHVKSLKKELCEKDVDAMLKHFNRFGRFVKEELKLDPYLKSMRIEVIEKKFRNLKNSGAIVGLEDEDGDIEWVKSRSISPGQH